MSVKISRYLLVMFLILSMLIIFPKIVHAADCYIKSTACTDDPNKACTPTETGNGDCYTYSTTDICTADLSSIGTCRLVCCCLDTGLDIGYGEFYTQYYCDQKISHSNITITTTDECNNYCHTTGGHKYNITGYIFSGGVAVDGALVTLDDNLNMNPVNSGFDGSYGFLDVNPGSHSLTATNSTCRSDQSVSLSQNMEINLSLYCSMVNVSGRVYSDGVTIAPSATIDALFNNKHTITASDQYGNFIFPVPFNTPVTITASNNLGCSGSTFLTTATYDSNNNRITLICGTSSVNGIISYNAIPVTAATVVANQSGITNHTDTFGAYGLSGLTPGSKQITATKTFSETVSGGNSETTCTNNAVVTLTDVPLTVNIDFDSNSCCNATTTKTICDSNNLYYLTTTYQGGACPSLNPVTSAGILCSNPLPPCSQTCNAVDWSVCNPGDTISTCLIPQTSNINCDPTLPPIPLPTKPCTIPPIPPVATCGDGVLDKATEACDWVVGSFFDINASCEQMWINDLKTRTPPVTVAAGAAKNNDPNDFLKSMMCAQATCKCNPLPPYTPPILPCNPTNTTLTGPFIASVKAAPIMNISWGARDCAAYINHFELSMCLNNSGLCTFEGIDPNIGPSSRNYSYTLNPTLANTQYCYQIEIVYNESVAEINRTFYKTACLNTSSANCMNGNQNSWCVGNVKWNCGATTNIATPTPCPPNQTCTLINGVATCIAQAPCDLCNGLFGIFGYQGHDDLTTSNGDSILCPSLTDRAPKSNNYPGILGGCYMDYTKSLVDKSYSCNNTISCYDYFSENACSNDYCGKFSENGTKQCQWINQTFGFSSMYAVHNIFYKGVCRPIIESRQQCELCNDNDPIFGHNRIDFSKCSENTCGMFGACYFEPMSSKCINKSSLKCTDYTSSDECIGNNLAIPARNVSTDVAWNNADQMSDGTNNRTSSNDGGILGGVIGVCKWDPSIKQKMGSVYGCFRDADNFITGGTRDCSIPPIANSAALLSNCQHDTIPPTSQIISKPVYGILMNLTGQITYSDNYDWGLGDDSKYCSGVTDSCPYILLRYCIVDVTANNTAKCYPNIIMDTTEFPYVIDLSKIGTINSGDTYKMYYFAEDPAKNLEIPKSFTFQIDTVVPVVNVTFDYKSYQNGNAIWLTNLTAKLSLTTVESGNVTCSFTLTPPDNASIPWQAYDESQYNLPTRLNPSGNKLQGTGSALSTTYPSLVEGVYNYQLDCHDAVGNPYSSTGIVSVEGSGLIDDPQPWYKIFSGQSLAAIGGNVKISINTSASGDCFYASDASSPATIPFTPNANKTFHSATVNLYQSGIYIYNVLCNLIINGASYPVQGGSTDKPTFAIDSEAPVTTIQIYDHDAPLKWADYDANGNYSSYEDVRFNCSDYDPSLVLGRNNMFFGCNATYYCIEQTSKNINCQNPPSNYVPYNASLTFNYRNGILNSNGVTDKSLYGKNPKVHYYSVDNGGNSNIQNPIVETLRIKNNKLEGPSAIAILVDTKTNVSNVTIQSNSVLNASHIIINISYPYETDVTLQNYTLRYYLDNTNYNYVEIVPQLVGGSSTGKSTYSFNIPYADNGKYGLTVQAIDDDGNSNLSTIIFNVKHDDNIITLVSPKVGIGSTQPYNIVINTSYASTCKHSMYDLAVYLNDLVAKYNDDSYVLFTTDASSQSNMVHSFSHDGTSGTMYVICNTSGTLRSGNNAGFAITSFNVGVMNTPPVINVSFIQNPVTRPNDNSIINSSYNATTLNISTDQLSVCQIVSSSPLPATSIRISPARIFPGENDSIYSKYNLTHRYMINYSGTTASAGSTYSYTITCTNLAQLTSSAPVSINFLPPYSKPVMSITVIASTLDHASLNVTCSGLCMLSPSEKYSYAIAKDNESCGQLPSTRYTKNLYSQTIELTNTSTACVIGFDVMGSNATANKSVVLNFAHGVMNITNPPIYKSTINSVYDTIYSPTKTFTLSMTTEIGKECRYALYDSLDVSRPSNYSFLYNQMTNKFNSMIGAPSGVNTHSASITINANAQVKETLEVICYEPDLFNSSVNNPNAYVTRELYMYWDDSAPQILMNVTPARINDWNKRNTVFFTINTSDNTYCSIDLVASTITDHSTGLKESLNYNGVDSVPLDNGTDDVVTSYKQYRTLIYNLPSKWLNDFYLNATYEFNVKCKNMAQLQSSASQSVQYDLDKEVIINVGNKSIFDKSPIQINFTTNVNSTCTVSVPDATPSISIPSTSTDGVHHTASLGASPQNMSGIHNVVLDCIVPTNGNIAPGHKEFTVTLDMYPPTINLSSIYDSSYVCSLNGFDIDVVMTDDTGIAGYTYTISGSGVNTSYGNASNNKGVMDNQITTTPGLVTRTGVIHYPGTLVEGQTYTIRAQATDLSGKSITSAPFSVTALTSTSSMDCDLYSPVPVITLAPTQFLDRIMASVSCTDADTECNESFGYTFTTAANCSGQPYKTPGVLGNQIQFNSSGLFCVKVTDLSGRANYTSAYVNITVNMSNPLNIRPASNMLYIYPRVIVVTTAVADINIATDAKAECRYSRTLLSNSSKPEDLFQLYQPFTSSFSTVHTISRFDTKNMYEQDIDIVCNSTNLATPIMSRRILTIVYTNEKPTLTASVVPELVYDWNHRYSTLTVETVPDTTCEVTINDAIHPSSKLYLGNHSNADTYMPKYITNLSYDPNTVSGTTFKYDVNCSTMSNNNAQAQLHVAYDINSVLDMGIAQTDFRNRSFELAINTSLISNCNLMFNNTNKGPLISSDGRQHSIKLTVSADGPYTAEFTCVTPVTAITITKTFTINIDTSVPPNQLPTASITLANTSFLDEIDATVTCSDTDGTCRLTFKYVLTNNTNCSSPTTFNSGISGTIGSKIPIYKDSWLCVQVQDDDNGFGYAKQYVDIPIDPNNPFEIRPIPANYVAPNVYVARANPTSIIVTTNVNANCKYSLDTPANYATSTPQQLYNNNYLPFETTFSKTHTIPSIPVPGYEQRIDIICYSTELLSANYSQKTLRIIYNTADPTITASVDPALINDWNYRQSDLSIQTAPETACTITSNDAFNQPYDVGNESNANTYSTMHSKSLSYTNDNPDVMTLYTYNIRCTTLDGRAGNSQVSVLYNISKEITIDMKSQDTFNTHTVLLNIETNLMSNCTLRWNNGNSSQMSRTASLKNHSITLSNVKDGQYTAEFTCKTPFTYYTTTKAYTIIVDTSVPPNQPPIATITTTTTTFLDEIDASVTCTDADNGCQPTYYYVLTNDTNANCSAQAYTASLSGTIGGNPIPIRKDALLCVKVQDTATPSLSGFAKMFIDIPIEVSNPFNITPIASNYVAPNVYIARTNPTSIIVTTNINAHCKYSLNTPANYASLSQQQRYDNFLDFDSTNSKRHTIQSVQLSGYEQAINIICYSTELASANFSERPLRIIYNTQNPIITAYADPILIDDWNNRQSDLYIDTASETACTITSNDAINQPYYLGDAANANTYNTKHVKNLVYKTGLLQTDIKSFYYDISCTTLDGRVSSTTVNVLYNISNDLTISLNSPMTFNTNSITLEIQTNLLSTCSLVWNNGNQTVMTKNNADQKIQYTRIANIKDGVYKAEISCNTPVTNLQKTEIYYIKVDTSVPPNQPPIATITTTTTTFLDEIDASVTCQDADDGCKSTYYYLLTNNTNINCSSQAYSNSRTIGGSPIQVLSDAVLCAKVQDNSGQSSYARLYINIPIDLNNPFNITPIASNYVAPNVYIARTNPTSIIVTTNINAHCKYSLNTPANYATLTTAQLYELYRDFDITDSKTHTIQSVQLSGYQQPIDIICYSTELLSANYSKRSLKIIYNTQNPIITAYADPILIDDWMDRQSELHIQTAPETTCTILTNDQNNQPYQLGTATDATNYSTMYTKILSYTKNGISDVILYYYDITCTTLDGKTSTATVNVNYDINKDLTISLNSPTIFNTKNILLEVQTNLISDCSITWDGLNQTAMAKNVTNKKIHYIKITNTNEGIHSAIITCITPVNLFEKTEIYTITVDTSAPPITAPHAGITLANTTYFDYVEATVTCTGNNLCKPTYQYSLTNRADCTRETYNNSRTLGGSPLQIFKDALLCVKVQDIQNLSGYAQAYVNVPAEANNAFNITPLPANYIQPNVYVAYYNPTDIVVTTNINATCKYSLNTPQNAALTPEQLYNSYFLFGMTNLTTHMIYGMVLSGYEQYLDIICFSNVLTSTNFSRKTLRVIYNTANPVIQAYAEPTLIDDWNNRKSYLNIETSPETTCTIASDDPNNQPYQLGDTTDATTYDTKFTKELFYNNLNPSDIVSYYYNIMCKTFNGNISNNVVHVTYNLSKDLTIELLSPLIYSTRNVEIDIRTNLLSDCNVRLNTTNQTVMTKNNSNQKIQSKTYTNLNNGASYTAEINCMTFYTNYNKILTYSFSIDTSLAIPHCGDGVINTVNEDCDGNTTSGLDNQTCKSLFNGAKYVGGELKCGSNCKYDYNKCDNGSGYCGDGIVEGPNTLKVFEQCDKDVPSDLSCGILGFQGGRLTCNDNCMLNTSRCTDLSTTGTTQAPTCNGLLLQSGEHCEDTFFNASSLTCTLFGYESGPVSCNKCTFDLSQCYMDVIDVVNPPSSHHCGNNYREGNEQCDGTSGISNVTCIKLGYTGGNVSCGIDCNYNASKCVNFTGSGTTPPPTNTCSNGKKDGTERDIDCGGSCPACGLNKNCINSIDCASGFCFNGKCALNACINKVFDSGTESDIDCGKDCAPCELNLNCTSNTDCKSNYCSNNKCIIDPCSNSVLDPEETDMDCGGTCAPCSLDRACIVNSDCESGLCRKNICSEPGPPQNPVKIPLMIVGLMMTLAGGGYIIYKTFIAKPSASPRYAGQFTERPGFGMPRQMPPSTPIVLTPEQKEMVLKQRDALNKKRQARLNERKNIIQQLESPTDEKNKDNIKDNKDNAKDKAQNEKGNMNNTKGESQKASNKEDKENPVRSDEFVELAQIAGSKDSSRKEAKETNGNDAFEKLKALNIDKTSKKIAQISKTPQENIAPALSKTTDLSDTAVIKMLGEMDRDTLMSGVFKEVLSDLLQSKKLTKENASKILFEYLDKDLLDKGDVAKISSELKII